MKRSFLVLATLAVVAFSAVGVLSATASPASAAATLSAQEAGALQYMREEEKLAHDVYRFLDARYGEQVAVFANIAASETRHSLAIKRLIARYGVSDPAQSDVPGVFKNEELQELYDALVSQGSVSLTDALQVGIAIETRDIDDLKGYRAGTDRTDIRRVYTNLLRASERHLAAFERHLSGDEATCDGQGPHGPGGADGR
jgi:hypothetical protein